MDDLVSGCVSPNAFLKISKGFFYINQTIK